MRSKFVLIWEVSGILFLIIVGSLLHFTFDWSHELTVVGMFCAVNESVWEHLKLGFWSLILFSVLEYGFIRNRTNNFLLAKALGLLMLQGCILIVFYTYTLFTGKPILFIDISSYILGAILCQGLSYLILTRKEYGKRPSLAGLTFILLHAVLLVVFTFWPPKLPIFQDSHSLSYGIQWKAP